MWVEFLTATYSATLHYYTHLPIKISSFLAKFSDKWQAFPLSPSFLTGWWLEEEAEASKEWLLGGGTGFARWSPISKGKRSL